jgi:hypothetical protein
VYGPFRAVGAAGLAHPELAELDVNPALVLSEGAFAVDVRARLLPAEVVT